MEAIAGAVRHVRGIPDPERRVDIAAEADVVRCQALSERAVEAHPCHVQLYFLEFMLNMQKSEANVLIQSKIQKKNDKNAHSW